MASERSIIIRRGTRWAAAVVACGALLAGCGAGGGDWPSAAGSPGTAAPGATPSAGTSGASGGGATAQPAASGPGAPQSGGQSGAGQNGGQSGDGQSGDQQGGGQTGAERCHTSELRGAVVADPGGGAAGSTYATLLLSNTGGRTCWIRGFPGVSYVGGDDGTQIGPAAAMSGDHGQPVRLAPGSSAGATLRMVNVANYDEAVCTPQPVKGLRVYPPGETASLFVPMDGTGCAGTPPGNQLVIQAFTAR